MDSMTEDLWAIIFARLPLKTITSFKLVCKQWKSIVESPFLRKLFLSHHQNSHSLWSLTYGYYPKEAMAHYGDDTWGLRRSLFSYVSSFVKEKFEKSKFRKARVVAYSDVGLILIRAVSIIENLSYYVANPISRECVEIDTPWFESKEYFWNLGIATRIENGVVLGYKIVLLYDAVPGKKSFSLLVYSSETGLWNLQTVKFPFSFLDQDFRNSISLNGKLHWIAHNNINDEAVVSIDFYGSGSDNDHPYRVSVTPFPDLEKSTRFNRCCRTCQGDLMYMNIVSQSNDHGPCVEYKLSVWRLKSGEWQLVHELASKNRFDHTFLLAINPFDANTVYFWNKMGQRVLSANLKIGKFILHDKFERGNDGRILSSMRYMKETNFSLLILPQWLYRIPNMMRRV